MSAIRLFLSKKVKRSNDSPAESSIENWLDSPSKLITAYCFCSLSKYFFYHAILPSSFELCDSHLWERLGLPASSFSNFWDILLQSEALHGKS